MKALVVDDSRMMRMTVRKLLETIGLEIVEAGDGKEALEQMAQHDIKLVMLDWNMPVMNGIECLKGIRAEEKYASVVVIMLTTENQMDAIREALTVGANEYIMKPFTDDMLIEKVKMVVPQVS